MDNTATQTAVTATQSARIRKGAERNVERWTIALADARRDGHTDLIPAIEQNLAFWARTASRDHTGRVIR